MERAYPSPEGFWRSTRALERTRQAALAWARAHYARRLRESGEADKAQAMSAYHHGSYHVESFRDQMPQIIRDLPPHFRAVEVGAGMGVHAALLAAHGAGEVVATEVTWEARTPFHVDNVSALYRIREMAPELDSVLAFHPADTFPVRVDFAPALKFARASADALPLPAGHADLVYSWNCLEHVPDPSAFFAEAARVLRIGGTFYSTTEPLYYSAEGHHLWDFFPLPWGHLLWPAEELVELVMKEGGEGREWEPGVPLTPAHLLRVLREELNYATPAEIREGLAAGAWKVAGWVDHAWPEYAALARDIGLYDAISGVSREALLLSGLRFRLQRTERAAGLRLPLRLSHLTRERLRRMRCLFQRASPCA